jgi:hypothetical protein
MWPIFYITCFLEEVKSPKHRGAFMDLLKQKMAEIAWQ